MVAKLIFYYIYWSLCLRVLPWRYFQINIEYFNAKKGFYSKIDIDKYIPKKWRLQQYYFDKDNHPQTFPVFIKPEWGQNANGVIRVDGLQNFLDLAKIKPKIPYIVQQPAPEAEEYEIFFILNANDKDDYAVLTITKVINSTSVRYPINSVNDNQTTYKDCTCDFSTSELELIKDKLRQLPRFRIARVGLKAESKQNLLKGLFHIIEINLFAPLPINLLDSSISKKNKNQFIKSSMYNLAKISATVSKLHFNRFVFFKTVIKHYQTKSIL